MNFSDRYHRLKRTLANPNISAMQRIYTWRALSVLLEKTNDRKAFTKYAKRLFNISLKIILTSPILSEYALRFTSLSNEEKQDFGQRFLRIFTNTHKITPVHFELMDDLDGFEDGAYSAKLKLIGVLKSSYTLNNLDSFMCIVLHEFTHHVYEHCPTFGPIPASQIKAITENGYLDFIASWEQPLELPARCVETYLEEHKFSFTLLSKIRQQMLPTKECR